MEKILFWGVAIGIGAVLGRFLRLSSAFWVLGGLVLVAFVGGIGAVILGLIRSEWLFLLLPVLPFGAVMALSAAVSNAFLGPREPTTESKGKS